MNVKVVTESGGRFAKWFRNVCQNCRSRPLLIKCEGKDVVLLSLQRRLMCASLSWKYARGKQCHNRELYLWVERLSKIQILL